MNPNVIKTSSQSLVMAAGAIARIVDPSGGKKLLADQTVTLASEGFTHATQVTLPNSGSQFVTSFADQNLQVEAVGTTVHEVNIRMKVALGRISRALTDLEHAGSIPSQNLIRILYTPSGIPIYFQGGSSARAVLSVALLGCGLTAFARHLGRNVGSRRRRRDDDEPGPGSSGGGALGRDLVGAAG